MKDKYRRMSEMGALPLTLVFLAAIILTFGNCKNKGNQSDASAADTLTDDALMDTVQRRTFLYFWEGAEPNSGLAPERYHVDGVYPQNDSNVVTSGHLQRRSRKLTASMRWLRSPAVPTT